MLLRKNIPFAGIIVVLLLASEASSLHAMVPSEMVPSEMEPPEDAQVQDSEFNKAQEFWILAIVLTVTSTHRLFIMFIRLLGGQHFATGFFIGF